MYPFTYVIFPTADLLQQYMETLVSASNIHVDWSDLGRMVVESAADDGVFMDYMRESQDDLIHAGHFGVTDESLEITAFRHLLTACNDRFHTVGFYNRPYTTHPVFHEWVCGDLVVKMEDRAQVGSNVLAAWSGTYGTPVSQYLSDWAKIICPTPPTGSDPCSPQLILKLAP
jgi:hypothetical protein